MEDSLVFKCACQWGGEHSNASFIEFSSFNSPKTIDNFAVKFENCYVLNVKINGTNQLDYLTFEGIKDLEIEAYHIKSLKIKESKRVGYFQMDTQNVEEIMVTNSTFGYVQKNITNSRLLHLEEVFFDYPARKSIVVSDVEKVMNFRYKSM